MDEKKLNDVHQYLRTWLDRSREVAHVAPSVQQLFEFVDWEKRTLEHRPTEASSISTSHIDKHTESLYGQITSSLPMIPAISRVTLKHLTLATASSTSAVVMYVSDVGRLETPDAVTYASNALTEYRQLQESHQRPAQIHSLLERAFPTIVQKFDSAHNACQQFIAGHGSETAAALEMRTFLDGLKGELYEKARHHSDENMTLDIVLERLFLSAPTRMEVKEQLKQRSVLIHALSSLAKRRGSSASYELEALWARVLDHVFILVSALHEATG